MQSSLIDIVNNKKETPVIIVRKHCNHRKGSCTIIKLTETLTLFNNYYKTNTLDAGPVSKKIPIISVTSNFLTHEWSIKYS